MKQGRNIQLAVCVEMSLSAVIECKRDAVRMDESNSIEAIQKGFTDLATKKVKDFKAV